MALQFNSFLTGTTGIPNAMAVNSMSSTYQRIRLYPNSVSFPSSAPANIDDLPGGYILEYTGFTVTAGVVPGTIIFAGAPGTTANASAAGTLAWGAYLNNSSGLSQLFITNSVVLNGNNGIFAVDDLTPSNGQTITITLALKLTV